jgi:hypothetical protein
MLVRQKALRPGKYRVGDYPVERFKQYAENTNRAIEAGLSIPVIDFHDDVDAKGSIGEAKDPRSALRNRGWAKRFQVTDDGWLEYELDITDAETANGLKTGSIRFTSPEFHENFFAEGIGELGSIIRHVALTPKPRNPIQGPFVEVPAGVSRFSLEDYVDDEEKKPGESEVEGTNGTENANGETDTSTDESPVNPDLPKDDAADMKMEAIVAQFSTIGIELPADWTFDNEGAADILLAALKTKSKADAEAAPKEEEAEDPPETQEADNPIAFSEDELATLPPHIRKAIEASQAENKRLKESRDKLNAKVTQFAEERTKAEREKTVASVKAMKLPPGLKKTLLGKLEKVQFSETGEAPTLTVNEAAAMFLAALPPSVRFEDDESEEVDPPKSDDKLSDEEAEKVVGEMFTRHKS